MMPNPTFNPDSAKARSRLILRLDLAERNRSMPVPYLTVQLYDINEISGPLGQNIGRKPTVKVVQRATGEWVIEVHNGMAQSSTHLGYLYDGQTNKPSSFSSKQVAAAEVTWASEFLVIEF
jgi:hypothetical protein